jgi:tRNA-2-methylthio-N6-dimethylallyladenosine synthase
MADANSSAAQPNTKGLFIKTYGCQMNVYDSERMRDVLKPLGYAPVDARGGRPRHPQHLPHPREGDREGLFRTRPLRDMKERRPAAACLRIAVAGCVAQAEGEEIMRRSRRSTWSWARRPIIACRR